MNITTIFLGVSVGATTTATAFLNYQTLAILVIGILAFALGSAGGVLLAKFMNLFTKNKINPLIGSAGVSAVPMAARVSPVSYTHLQSASRAKGAVFDTPTRAAISFTLG